MTDHDGFEPFENRSEILLGRQRALQDEAAAVLAELDLSRDLLPSALDTWLAVSSRD